MPEPYRSRTLGPDASWASGPTTASVVAMLVVAVLHGVFVKRLLASRATVRQLESYARRRTEMLTAANQLTRLLVAGRSPDFTAGVTRTAVRVGQGDFAFLAVAPSTGQPMVVNTAGTLPRNWVGQPLKSSSGLVEKVIRTGSPRVVPDLELESGGRRLVASVICVPLPGLHAVGGALVVGRLVGGFRPTTSDLELLVEYADQVEVALELDRARASGEAERLVEDRSHIAAEVQAQVITRLFTLSLELLSVAGGAPGPDAKGRLLAAVKELDSTIAWLRASILGPVADALGSRPLTRQVIAAVDEFGQTPGHEVRLDLSNLEVGLPVAITQEAAMVVREVLKGVARRVDSGTTAIKVSSVAPDIVVEVTTSGPYEDALDAGVAEHLQEATLRGTLKIISHTHETCIRWTWHNNRE